MNVQMPEGIMKTLHRMCIFLYIEEIKLPKNLSDSLKL